MSTAPVKAIGAICRKCHIPSPCKCGKPTKLTPRFIEAFQRIVKNNDLATIIFTDKELLERINMELEPKERVLYNKFECWKRGDLPRRANNLGKLFLDEYKKAFVLQKENLFRKLSTDSQGWQRWAWVIERKWQEWKQAYKIETDGGSKEMDKLREEMRSLLTVPATPTYALGTGHPVSIQQGESVEVVESSQD